MIDILKENESYVFYMKVPQEMQNSLKVFESCDEFKESQTFCEDPFFNLFRKMPSEVKDSIRKGQSIPINRNKLVVVDGEFYLK